MPIHQILRPSGKIADGGFAGVDAQPLVEGGEDFAEMDGAGDRFAAEAVGRADWPGMTSSSGVAETILKNSSRTP